MKIKLTACFVLVILSFSTFAADKSGNAAIRNVGNMPCNKFVEEKKKDSPLFTLSMGWFDGYASAANQLTDNTFDLMPWGSTPFIMNLLESHCKVNPKELFHIASKKLLVTFSAERLLSSSPLIKVEHNNKSMLVYKGVLMKVQEVLKKENFYSSTVDGEYGPGTRRAIEKFQKANKLPVNGLPDQPTLHSVLLKLMDIRRNANRK